MPLLKGFVELDASYIRGKAGNEGISKRGRGTENLTAIGTVDRGGNVAAETQTNEKVNTCTLRGIVIRIIQVGITHSTSIYCQGYKQIGSIVKELSTISRSETYVHGNIDTNSVERFWMLLKQVHCGQHHHNTMESAPIYFGETYHKCNHREIFNRKKCEIVFNSLIGNLSCTAL